MLLIGYVKRDGFQSGVLTSSLSGTTFTHWIADHNVLWRSPLTKDALEQSIYYYSLLSNAPTGLGWVYIAAGVLALASAGGRMMKDWKGRHGEVIFDGGSLCEGGRDVHH